MERTAPCREPRFVPSVRKHSAPEMPTDVRNIPSGQGLWDERISIRKLVSENRKSTHQSRLGQPRRATCGTLHSPVCKAPLGELTRRQVRGSVAALFGSSWPVMPSCLPLSQRYMGDIRSSTSATELLGGHCCSARRAAAPFKRTGFRQNRPFRFVSKRPKPRRLVSIYSPARIAASPMNVSRWQCARAGCGCGRRLCGTAPE